MKTLKIKYMSDILSLDLEIIYASTLEFVPRIFGLFELSIARITFIAKYLQVHMSISAGVSYIARFYLHIVRHRIQKLSPVGEQLPNDEAIVFVDSQPPITFERLVVLRGAVLTHDDLVEEPTRAWPLPIVSDSDLL